MNLLRIIIIVASVSLQGACSIGSVRHWDVQDGLVLDATTQNPIEGAIVVARWQGWISALVDASSVCYHVETAKSDAEGHFRIPKWTKLPGKVHHGDVVFSTYKAGYRQVHGENKKLYDVQSLKRDLGSSQDRLCYLFRLPTVLNCGVDGSEGQYYSVLNIIFAEAKQLFDGLVIVPQDLAVSYQVFRRQVASVNVDPDYKLSRAAREKAISAYLEGL